MIRNSRMRLNSDWRRIVREAWSFRLNALASVFATGEAVLPLWSDAIPRGWFAMLTLVVVLLSMVARVISQKAFCDDPPK